MVDSPREAAAAAATAASSAKPAKPAGAGAAKPAAVAAAIAPAASVQPGAEEPARGGADDGSEAEELSLILGRPNLSQNTIEELRARNRLLKKEQKMVKQQLSNQKRKRARVMKRMRNLDTTSVLQVLMDRGIDLTAVGGGSASGEPRQKRQAISPAAASSAAVPGEVSDLPPAPLA